MALDGDVSKLHCNGSSSGKDDVQRLRRRGIEPTFGVVGHNKAAIRGEGEVPSDVGGGRLKLRGDWGVRNEDKAGNADFLTREGWDNLARGNNSNAGECHVIPRAFG